MTTKSSVAKNLVPIDNRDFVSNEYLSLKRSEDNISSSMFDCVFIPSKKVPTAIVKMIEDPEIAEKVILQEKALMEKTITKPYWDYDMHIEIFSAVCLADDRHFLDTVLGNASYLGNVDKYTLRQVVEEGIGLGDVDWEAYKNNERIDQYMHNTGNYYHISIVDVCKALGLKVQKATRQRIVERIRRLRNMEIRITPKVKGELQHTKANEIHLLGQDYHLLLDRSKMKGNLYNQDTFTDIIVNVNDYYQESLEKDGYISRKRLQNHYIHLIGKNNISDFYKYLDSHKRDFLHHKFLSDLIIDYFDKKMGTFGINKWHKIRQIYNQIIDDPAKLLKHFGFKLYLVERDNQVNKDKDYQLSRRADMEGINVEK